jgi:GNAT superfamily N-acetyltransferase
MLRTIDIDAAARPAELEAARALLRAYAEEQGFKLCFQGFEAELAGLPGDYAEPRGCLLLARRDGAAIGLVALKPVDERTAELKRLFLLPAGRGEGLGRRLAEAALARARAKGYRRVLLETLDGMIPARALYARLGFRAAGRDASGIERFALELEGSSAPRLAGGGQTG